MRVTGAEKRAEVPAAAAGYSAEDLGDGRARFQATIAGLHCSLCAGVIERGLYEQPGVDKVSVTGPDTQVLVDYDPGRVGPEQLLQTLDDLGFSVGNSPAARRAQGSDEDTAKIVREGRRFLQLVALSAVTIVLMALGMLHLIGSWSYWVLGVFAIASMVIAPQLLVATVESRHRGLLSTAPVVRASAFGGLVGGIIGLAFRPAAYPTGGFFAVTVLVITYHVFSRWLALVMRTQSSQSVTKLLDLQPAIGRLVRDGVEGDVPIRAVRVGDRIRVRPGERVPIDGRVAAGHSVVDESLMTGESAPVKKAEGDEVIGGSINGSGTLLVEVSRVGADTFLAQIIHKVEDARELKPGVVDLVGRVLKVYIPAVLVLAPLAGVLWLVVPLALGDGLDLHRVVFATLGVLIMAYPCAMGMVAPLTLARGAADAAERGIILRTGDAFQSFGQVRRIAFDKTGTLTEGVFTVREMEAIGDSAGLLGLAAAAEAPSEHPLGAAIVTAAHDRGVALPTAEEFEAVSGHGVRAAVDGAVVLVGRPSFVGEGPGGLGRLADRAAELEEAGRTVVAVSRDGALQGLIALGDEIRAGARAALDDMRHHGITPVMVTGDNRRAAKRVAAELGIEEVRAEVLPQDKAEIVRDLQRHGRVAMVGDGINDAPALAQADVGVAMGGGTDVAIESADVIIVGNRLDAVLAARDIGWRSYRRTQHNVVLAFVFNGIGVPLAATGLVDPIWAMVAMFLSVTAVLANSMRGKWTATLSTLWDLVKRQKLEQPATA